ncbi:MAG TPA: hypothetical protein PLN55_12180 [Burkholderiaceae bacterium]|nr:hypothetical protein [Burkholderiaceae bacterium]
MAVTQEQVDALNQAIADGVRQVTINGQSTTYNTTASLIQARDDLQSKLNAETLRAAGKAPNKRLYLYQSGRGY